MYPVYRVETDRYWGGEGGEDGEEEKHVLYYNNASIRFEIASSSLY